MIPTPDESQRKEAKVAMTAPALNPLLPRQVAKTIAGTRPRLALRPALLMKVSMSVNSIFNGRLVASSADGIPLDTSQPPARRRSSRSSRSWGSLSSPSACSDPGPRRYRALIATPFSLLLWSTWQKVDLPLPSRIRTGDAAASTINLILLALMVVGLVLSLRNRAQRKGRSRLKRTRISRGCRQRQLVAEVRKLRGRHPAASRFHARRALLASPGALGTCRRRRIPSDRAAVARVHPGCVGIASRSTNRLPNARERRSGIRSDRPGFARRLDSRYPFPPVLAALAPDCGAVAARAPAAPPPSAPTPQQQRSRIPFYRTRPSPSPPGDARARLVNVYTPRATTTRPTRAIRFCTCPTAGRRGLSARHQRRGCRHSRGRDATRHRRRHREHRAAP